MEIALLAIRALIVVALYTFLGVVLWALLRERSAAQGQQPAAARLVTLNANAGEGISYPLALRGPTWIGRDPNCPVRVSNDFASSRHAWIEWRDAKQAWWIEDNDSRNGTLVNDERIIRSELRPADVIDIGGVRFRFEAEGGT